MSNEPTTIPIVALDYASATAALDLVDELADACRFYKVGSELFTAAGPDIVREVRRRGADVFLDLKFHDIPNTVAGGVRSAVSSGARLVTVHASGGRAMIDAAVAAAGDSCGILAVTVLTSLNPGDVAIAWGRSNDVDVSAEVERLAGIAASAGAHGVVCSGHEAVRVKRRFGGQLSILVPGVRTAGAGTQDQSRVVTPRAAAEAGARYIVVGRMVTAAPNRRLAFSAVRDELSLADASLA
ncbi:MAG TPA: orotidine-5'-phosphate decarboxylase [Gemmatimonadaceae bacterium]|nr:orotidine-5'-phosphate decarboxylase [Gemmatimonadaceae bacterium]